MEFDNAVILDNGSGCLKAGFAGDIAPTVVLPTVIGETAPLMRLPTSPRSKGPSAARPVEELIGDAALAQRGKMTLRYPVVNGQVTDWEDMEKIWNFVFEQKLAVETKDYPILVTDAVLGSLLNRAKIFEFLFEKYQYQAVAVGTQAILSLYATARTTGAVIDSGEGVTHVVPIYEGYIVDSAVRRLDLAGGDVNRRLATLLNQREDCHFTSTAEMEIIREIKQKLCYMTVDEKRDETEEDYELPDGRIIQIGKEKSLAPEILFDPSSMGIKEGGLHTLMVDAVESCEIDTRRDLYSNIMLSGGNTLFRGMADRMTKEMSKLQDRMPIDIVALPDREYAVFSGASVLATLPSFEEEWVSPEMYKEHGSSLFQRTKR